MGRSYEIVFVNDGSADGSGGILEELAQSDPRVILIDLRRNFGKAMALSVGFKEARGNIVITMDGDLQDNPIEMPRFVAEVESGHDLVSGWKLKRQDPLSKTLPSRLFNKVVSLATGLRIHDFNCGFKAYSRNVLENLRIYLHFFGSLGLIFMFLGFAINAYLAVWWFMGHAIGHRPLLSLGILLMVMGVQFVSTGLVGEMITRNQQPDEGSFIARKVNSPKRGDES